MKRPFLARIRDLQPSQLYINADKLEAVHHEFDPVTVEKLPPVPVIELNGKITITDGHSRLFAAHQAGLEMARVYWDEDELDLGIYSACVKWCVDEGITSVAGLDSRIIDDATYQQSWIAKCEHLEQEMHK